MAAASLTLWPVALAMAACDCKFSSQAGVNSVTMSRPTEALLTPQAPSVGIAAMKTVSSHNGSNWPICATGPGSHEGNGESPDNTGPAPIAELITDLREKVSLIGNMQGQIIRILKDYQKERPTDQKAGASAKAEIVVLSEMVKIPKSQRDSAVATLFAAIPSGNN